MLRLPTLIFLSFAVPSLYAVDLRFDFHGIDGRPDSLVLDQFLVDGRKPSTALSMRTLSPGVTEISAENSADATWSFSVADVSGYYGFGERFDSLNHAHTILQNASRDMPNEKGTLSYQPIPFYMSLRGYGLWLDTTSEAVFDLNVSDPAHILVKFYDRHLRVILFEGPGFPTILERFTALVGRQQLPPYWAFAPWKARDYYRNSQEVYEDIDRYRAFGLPASVLLIDSPWATNYNTYEFDRKQFTNPKAMIASVHNEGFKLILWHTPWINSKTARPYEDGFADKLTPGPASNFAEADHSGYFLHRPDGSTYIGRWWKGVGALIDFTNPAAKKWWQNQLEKVISLGADGFKDDDAEGAFLGDVVFAGGEDQRVMRNRYAVEYNRAVAEALAVRKGSDWVLFQRSGTVGNHMLPMFWSGDNDATFSESNGLPSVVTAGLNAGMSGISLWVSDLGGYNKSERTSGDSDLFIRWTEYSAFSPGMEVMSSLNLGPWDYGEKALRIFRQFSVLHMSLFPYRYAAAMESARTGLPMMRALVLMHQDDRQAREATTEYYFGPDLLVAPVLSAVTQRSVYLPEGTWIDFWSGRCVAGRQTISVEAPLDRIPLFVRYGTVLPKIPDDVMTLVQQTEFKDQKVKALDDRRIYELYPGRETRYFTDFEQRHLVYDPTGRKLTIDGASARIRIQWKITRPAKITLNGRPINELKTRSEGVAVEYHHQGTSTLSWN